MLKEKITPKENKIEINIPEEYVNKEVEVTVRLTNGIADKEKIKIIDESYGIMNIENLDDEVKKLRDEWDREF